MDKKQSKVKTVMHEFKKGELHSGKSGKIVKNPKQAIAIALSEAGMSKKRYAQGGAVKGNQDSSSAYGTQVGDFNKFLNSDGYKKGGIDVEVSSAQETQEEQVKGQRRMLPEKKTKAKWF
jgi:ribosomal protein L21E